jgi:hypothetical protein
MQQFSDEQENIVCIPLSKYVLTRAYEQCREQLTAAIKAVAITFEKSLAKRVGV